MNNTPRILVTTLLCVALFGCTSSPDGEEVVVPGTFEPLPTGPAGIEDVVQHLVDAPPFPDPVAGEAVLVELRSPDFNRRHHTYMARLDADGTLDGDIFRGSFLHVAAGVSVTLPSVTSVASLDGDSVTSVTTCDAPCVVTGPALVAPDLWFQSIQADEGWVLIDPAPES